MVARSEMQTLRVSLSQFKNWLSTIELGKEVALAGVNFIPTKVGDDFVAGNTFGFDFDCVKIKAVGYDIVVAFEKADWDYSR